MWQAPSSAQPPQPAVRAWRPGACAPSPERRQGVRGLGFLRGCGIGMPCELGGQALVLFDLSGGRGLGLSEGRGFDLWCDAWPPGAYAPVPRIHPGSQRPGLRVQHTQGSSRQPQLAFQGGALEKRKGTVFCMIQVYHHVSHFSHGALSKTPMIQRGL